MDNEAFDEQEQPASGELGYPEVLPSLTDQVLADLFSKLGGNSSFSPGHVAELRALASAGALRKVASVRAALEMEGDATS